MGDDVRLGRYLGATFLVVFVGSVLSEALTLSPFSDSTADSLDNIAGNTLGSFLLMSSSILLLATGIDLFFLAFPTGLFELVLEHLAHRQWARSERTQPRADPPLHQRDLTGEP